MFVVVTRMIASVGFSIVGSETFSTRTSRLPCQVTARMGHHCPTTPVVKTRGVLHPSIDTVRIFLHVLAATIWVGGQLTLAGLVPTLRTEAPDAVVPAARRFALLAWPAFAVLVITGVWNLVEVDVAAPST